MTQEVFWLLIEKSREHFRSERSDGNMDGQVYALRALLLELPAEEVAHFADIMHTMIIDAYTWALWGAADALCEGSCSDDSFTDFRSWLVSMGRRTYEEAITSPDSLARSVDDPTVENFFFEAFQYVPAQVYEEITGDEVSDYTLKYPQEPKGERLWEAFEDHEQLYPKIWAAVTLT